MASNVKNAIAFLLLVAAAVAAIALAGVGIVRESSLNLVAALAPVTPSATGPHEDTSQAEHGDEEALRLTFAGDLMAHSVNFRMPDFDAIYERVADVLRNDDLSFVNLEFPVDENRPYSSYPRFNVHPEYVHSAIRAGFEVFSAANNHTADWHREGIDATASFLRRAGDEYSVAWSGIRSEPGAGFEITEIRRRGWTIGFLAVTQFSNEWREYAGLDRVHLVSYRSTLRSEAFLEWISDRTSQYDLFVLSYHGGDEYALTADPRKLAFFRRLIEAGIDVVWGHHPHVLQPWEIVERADGSMGLIIPSAGNFVSGQPWRLGATEWDSARAATGDSALYEVLVEREQGGVRLAVDLVPITHRRGPDGVVVRRLPTVPPEDEWAVYDGQRHRISATQLALLGPPWFVD